jgi:hypothetical protein
MHLLTDIRKWDQKLHYWEHDLLLSSEKFIHTDAFWVALIVAFMLLGLMFLTIFSRQGSLPMNMYPAPFGPLY